MIDSKIKIFLNSMLRTILRTKPSRIFQFRHVRSSSQIDIEDKLFSYYQRGVVISTITGYFLGMYKGRKDISNSFCSGLIGGGIGCAFGVLSPITVPTLFLSSVFYYTNRYFSE